MGTIFGKSLLLLVVSLVICCVIYPAVLWAIGQTAFPFQADGSMVKDSGGNVVGSLLIGQGFTKDEYFQPRPSATATPYDASASGPSALAASNYALRGRVAAAIGPIATYKDGRTVGPDIEKWFQQDRYQGKPSIVAQWADLHQGFNGSNGMAQGWVSADPTHAQYVSDWAKAHPAIVAQWVKDNPGTPNPQATDLAVVFFENFSKDNPGKFLSAAPAPATAPATAASATASAPVMAIVQDGADIQSTFFDMWRQDHPDAQLQDVPGDMVTTSCSGLDPHITLQSAEFQLPRVAAKWAADKHREVAEVRKEIEQLLQNHAFAPWDGLAGEKIVNVLEVNLELRSRYGPPS